MTRADGVPGRYGQFRSQSGTVQRGGYGVQRHSGGVVITAQVGQNDVTGAVFRQCDGKVGGILVAQVTLKTQNALLQVIGIGAGAKRLYIMVGL